MPLIDPDKAFTRIGTGYPAELNKPCATRIVKALGDAGGLTQFGAHLVTLPPGCWASQRHAHSHEDEFCYILTGHPTLIDDDGETPLKPGDAMTHKAGDGNAHHLINKTDKDVTFLAVGSRRPDVDSTIYPDVDLAVKPGRIFARKDGSPV